MEYEPPVLIREGIRTAFGTVLIGLKVFVLVFPLGMGLFVLSSVGEEGGMKVSEIRCGCGPVVVSVLVEQ